MAAKTTKKIPAYYGKGGRLKKSPSQILIKTAYQHDCDQANYLLEGLHKANLAHAIMLYKQGVIPGKEAKKIIKAIIKINKINPAAFPMDPKFGDVYNNVDVQLKALIGDSAGWLHAGRPRREAVNVAYILATKTRLLNFYNQLISLCEITIEIAKAHGDTIMPDYTYLHHAHPTVLGHYIMTFLFPALRDLKRLKNAFENLNQCNAGSGSVNGSRLPLDRNMLSKLLGFDSVIPHARDAMWQMDVPMEILNNVSTCISNWSRLVEELIIWNTKEFSLIELPDDLCRASVIMPQKKNPYPLNYFRGLANNVLGKLASFSALGKVASGNPDSRIFIYDELPGVLDKSSGAIELLAAVLKGASFNASLMYQRAKEDYSYTTDLADIFIMKYKIDYRSAHQIMGKVVQEMNAINLKGNEIKIDYIQKAAHALGINNISMTQKELEKTIAPENIVKSRTSKGGAGKTQMKSMIALANKELNQYKTWHKAQNNKAIKSKANLFNNAKALIK